MNSNCVYYKDATMMRFEFIADLSDSLIKFFKSEPKRLKKIDSEIYNLIAYNNNDWQNGGRRNITKLHISVSLKML